MSLLFSNTLDEVVDWLTATTGEAWSVRRVLDEILAHEELLLEVVPPRDAQFGIYLRGHFAPERGYLPVGPFSRLGVAEPRLRFPLRDEHIVELLEYGEAQIFYAQVPADDDLNGRWVIHEPMSGPPLRVTLDMCRVSAADARVLAGHCIAERTSASSIVATSSMDPPDTESNRSVAGSPNASVASAEPGRPDDIAADSEEWRVAARRLADELALARWKRGEREISARSISRDVERELAKPENKRYWGNRGPRSASIIRNVSLAGWTFTPPEDAAMGSG